MHYKVAAPVPKELMKWELAKEFGWTLDYIDSLSLQDVHEYYQIKDGKLRSR